MKQEDIQGLLKGIAETPDGVRFFKWLMHDLCSYDISRQVDSRDDLLWFEGQRQIWLTIRRGMPKHLLADIEVFGDKENK